MVKSHEEHGSEGFTPKSLAGMLSITLAIQPYASLRSSDGNLDFTVILS